MNTEIFFGRTVFHMLHCFHVCWLVHTLSSNISLFVLSSLGLFAVHFNLTMLDLSCYFSHVCFMFLFPQNYQPTHIATSLFFPSCSDSLQRTDQHSTMNEFPSTLSTILLVSAPCFTIFPMHMCSPSSVRVCVCARACVCVRFRVCLCVEPSVNHAPKAV